jgi:hypothetical protein
LRGRQKENGEDSRAGQFGHVFSTTSEPRLPVELLSLAVNLDPTDPSDSGLLDRTAYTHLERFAAGLCPGNAVRQGDLIGAVGSNGRATGPHLHYEFLVAGRQVDRLATALTAAQIYPAAGAVGPAAFGWSRAGDFPTLMRVEDPLGLKP